MPEFQTSLLVFVFSFVPAFVGGMQQGHNPVVLQVMFLHAIWGAGYWEGVANQKKRDLLKSGHSKWPIDSKPDY